jgi:hypothetical protein
MRRREACIPSALALPLLPLLRVNERAQAPGGRLRSMASPAVARPGSHCSSTVSPVARTTVLLLPASWPCPKLRSAFGSSARQPRLQPLWRWLTLRAEAGLCADPSTSLDRRVPSTPALGSLQSSRPVPPVLPDVTLPGRGVGRGRAALALLQPACHAPSGLPRECSRFSLFLYHIIVPAQRPYSTGHTCARRLLYQPRLRRLGATGPLARLLPYWSR